MADDKKIEQFSDELGKIQSRIVELKDILGKDLVDSLSKNVIAARRLSEPLKDAASISAKMNKLADENELLIIKRKVAEEEYVKALKKGKAEQIESTEKTLKNLSAQLQVKQRLEDQLKTLGQIAEEEKRVTEEKKKQNSLGEAITKGFEKNFGITRDTLKETFSLVGMIDMMVKGLKTSNENSVWISKNLGYGATAANMMTYEMQGMSLLSNETNVTLKNAGEAMAQLASATGGVTEFSEDALKTQIMLTKQLGLSGEEAAGIYKFSLLTGKSSEKVNDEMLAAFANTRNMVKGSANFKETMAAAAKVSGQLAANFKNNPAEITKAVVQAQALGTTLEKTKSQGASLLNFETSIEDELKAELLTGQQMNLERARAAALQGDQVTVMKELANQGMTIEKFQSMNVLAQESFAKALGLSADELSDQLNKQKMATEQGKSLAEVNAEELKAAEKRKTIQDRFNNMMEKLQDIVGSIGTLFMPIVDAITWVLDHSIAVYGFLGLWLLTSKGIAANFKGIVGSIKSIGSSIGNKIMGKGGGGVEKAAETTASAGGKAGAGGPGAGEGIKGTLKGISAGIKSFSKVSPADIGKLALSALALIALTPAIPALLLLQFVNGKLIQGALEGVGKGLAAFGKAVSKAAPEILIGEALLAGLGLALWTFVPIVKAVGDVVSTIFTSIANGVSTVVGAIGDMIVKLGEVGPSLLLLGPALFGIAGGLAAMGFSGLLALPSILALTALGAVAPALSSLGIGGGGGKEEKSNEMATLISAVNGVKASVDKLYTKDSSVHMDGKKVGTTLSQNSHKVA
jgi:hypothetical protein